MVAWEWPLVELRKSFVLVMLPLIIFLLSASFWLFVEQWIEREILINSVQSVDDVADPLSHQGLELWGRPKAWRDQVSLAS